jgi:sphingolipid C9-methyltransferase
LETDSDSFSADEEQVRDHYDRGDDFYGWFLGPRMVYTSGVISDPNQEESLEQLQDNKLAIVCEKIDLKPGERLLDIGCGWGTLAKFASVNYGAKATGITLGRNQTAWGNNGLRKAGISEEQSNILCMDYRDIPVPEGKYNKITCLEMAEHVGIRHLTGFLKQCNEMMDDDGVFFLQVAGLRKSWQYEDLIWGLFMNKYIFPGADASTPLNDYIRSVESAGWEVKSVDTIGVHYSATLWRWYRNWLANKDKVLAKYGNRWYRVSLISEKTYRALLTNLDLGVLPCLLHHHFSPRLCDLLPDHPRQELELHSPCRGHSHPVRFIRGPSSQQSCRQGTFPEE